VTCESDCYEFTSQAANIVEELNSTQEEADTRLILHAAHQLDRATRRWLGIRRYRSILALPGV